MARCGYVKIADQGSMLAALQPISIGILFQGLPNTNHKVIILDSWIQSYTTYNTQGPILQIPLKKGPLHGTPLDWRVRDKGPSFGLELFEVATGSTPAPASVAADGGQVCLLSSI